MPETNRNNNIMRTKGVFKKIEPLKPQIIGSLYNPKNTQIFYYQKINYNIYKKNSIGLNIYNQFLAKDGFSYKLTPLYSIGTKDINGEIKFSYTKYSQSAKIHTLKLGVDAKQYSYDYRKKYQRIMPHVNIRLQKKYLRSKINNYISASYVYLIKQNERLKFLNGKYTYSNARTFNPFSIHSSIEKSKE